jgi:hypothetical protein
MRVVSVVEPAGERLHRIHFAGDVADVIENLWIWNEQVDGVRTAWTRRPIQFFVFDQRGGLFAPSKFCAFVPARIAGGTRPPPTMTLEVYATLGEKDPRFDGHVARRHLIKRLAFRDMGADDPEIVDAFKAWLRRYASRVSLRPPVRVLLPPPWYR